MQSSPTLINISHADYSITEGSSIPIGIPIYSSQRAGTLNIVQRLNILKATVLPSEPQPLFRLNLFFLSTDRHKIRFKNRRLF